MESYGPSPTPGRPGPGAVGRGRRRRHGDQRERALAQLIAGPGHATARRHPHPVRRRRDAAAGNGHARRRGQHSAAAGIELLDHQRGLVVRRRQPFARGVEDRPAGILAEAVDVEEQRGGGEDAPAHRVQPVEVGSDRGPARSARDTDQAREDPGARQVAGQQGLPGPLEGGGAEALDPGRPLDVAALAGGKGGRAHPQRSPHHGEVLDPAWIGCDERVRRSERSRRVMVPGGLLEGSPPSSDRVRA